ncbi:MAG: sigma-54 dependent transcriptional regulator [Gammaproteobacteria bacterium]|nr:sigma-54 dependent transcriptional regulator [Gammaproteobacteria bacterium]
MVAKKALIVDDEPDIRELLEITLGRMNIETAAAQDIATARNFLENDSFDLCLTDMHLPDGNGIELVDHIAQHKPGLPVAVITAFGSMDTAISALKAGAFDFVQKPVDLEQLRTLVDTALKVTPISSDASGDSPTRLTGQSATMHRLREQIAKLARSQAPIYISGESGSGKEVAARLIHEQGPRGEAPFVPVNCGAIPSELMESEFFGHEKGSFTGAVADKQGLFQAAEGGTLFLDEVADLPLSMQVKLLRAIQEKAVRAVGSAQEHGIDVRILSATHKDLASEVAEDRFRQDLYYRLNVIELAMPSLRERTDDIPELAEQVLARLADDYGEAKPVIDDSAMHALQRYAFPGNVRELENILERAFTLCEKNCIQVEDLQLEGGSSSPRDDDAMDDQPATALDGTEGSAAQVAASKLELAPEQSLEEFLERIERQLITDALEATRWNKTAAAKRLGITFRALRYRLKKLELE